MPRLYISLHLRIFSHLFQRRRLFKMGSDNRGPQVSGVASFFLALSTIVIILRAYCRVCVVKNFGYDDWFAIIAWV